MQAGKIILFEFIIGQSGTCWDVSPSLQVYSTYLNTSRSLHLNKQAHPFSDSQGGGRGAAVASDMLRLRTQITQNAQPAQVVASHLQPRVSFLPVLLRRWS